jgi:hypothetical protein
MRIFLRPMVLAVFAAGFGMSASSCSNGGATGKADVVDLATSLQGDQKPGPVECPEGFILENALCLQEPIACVHKCADRECGDDGCGGSCGNCDGQDLCTIDGACVCVPDCKDLQCGGDGCGGQCGSCPAGFACEANICAALPCEPDCEGEECAVCPDGTVCEEDGCKVPDCVPQCDDRECGIDGCGGQCGSCPEQGYCSAGLCYDCSEEGLCRASSCPDDGNPCTQEMVAANGECYAVPNYVCKEILEELQRIYRGAQAYYGTWYQASYDDMWHPQGVPYGGHLNLVQDVTPSAGTCCWALGGPDVNEDNLCDNENGGDYFMTPTWQFLDFTRSEPHRFVYEFEESVELSDEFPKADPYEQVFEARVIADLDCDGAAGVFVVKGFFSPDPEGGYLPLSVKQKLFNNLSIPLTVEYRPEHGESEPQKISSVWPITDPTEEQLSEVYAILLEGTYMWRFREAFVNLIRIDSGAYTYYRSPKVMAYAPPELTAQADKQMLETWADHIPEYQPLMQGLTPVSGSCCAGKGADNDYDNRCDPNPEVWGERTWGSLKFGLWGSHQWLYGFKELEVDKQKAIYRGEAFSDLNCDGNWERLFLLTGDYLTNDLGIPKSWRFEYLPVFYNGEGDPAVSTTISPDTQTFALFQDMVGESWGPWEATPLPYSGTHGEAFFYLDQIEAAISSHWESNCSLPDPPEDPTPPGWWGCTEDADDNGLCDANPEAWNHEFWTAIGFKIEAEHLYQFEVESNTISPAHLMIETTALGAHQYSGGDSLSFRKYGIASDVDGECSVKWFEGYNTGTGGPMGFW